jgi:hypothetical protein
MYDRHATQIVAGDIQYCGIETVICASSNLELPFPRYHLAVNYFDLGTSDAKGNAMDYDCLNKILGRDAVSRLEDAVLLAANAAKKDRDEGPAALRHLLIAMLGTVIWNDRKIDRTEIHHVADKSIQLLRNTLAILDGHRQSKPASVASPSVALVQPQKVASETAALVQLTTAHLERMRKLNRQTTHSILKSKETLRESTSVLSLCSHKYSQKCDVT